MEKTVQENVVQQSILTSLREFYPIRVDDVVLFSAVQKKLPSATIDDITRNLQKLIDGEWVEESIVKPPFGEQMVRRLKITSSGIDYLQEIEGIEEIPGVVYAKEIESRLIETYDRIKDDMEEMRRGLETSQKSLEHDMDGMRSSISDHDQVIKTYFVRVIETFGIFVGIFAVVVVAMISSINVALQQAEPINIFIILIALPCILVLVLLSLLWGIKKMILDRPQH
jgi:hypothetical protein